MWPKLVVIFLILINNVHATETEKLICSFIHSFAAVKRVKPLPKIDKFKHCSVSCLLSLKCDAEEVYYFGLLKELADALGTGTPDEKDIEANKIGIQLVLDGIALDDNECLKRCDEVDWTQL